MRNFREYLNKTIDEMVDIMKTCDCNGESDRANWYERLIADYKEQVNILNEIIQSGEGNLIKFNEDGTFELWSIRCPYDGDVVVEHYDDDMTFSTYEELIELSKCRDVTDTFDKDRIFAVTTVTNDPRHQIGFGGYFLTTEDAILEAVNY